MFDDVLLDDPSGLAAADPTGLLRASAGAGAQVRATAEAVAEADLSRWAGAQPRALVLVHPASGAPDTAELIDALLGPACPVPVVLAETVPRWAGALDVVLAHCDDAGDVDLAESVARAAGRGARVLVTAPEDGPVAAAAAGAAL
ncbi:MAG: hypothetical protein J2O49_06445, partial [Sciscionella sp.]|nr:hypothetical protein [Sciscionella sp.]